MKGFLPLALVLLACGSQAQVPPAPSLKDRIQPLLSDLPVRNGALISSNPQEFLTDILPLLELEDLLILVDKKHPLGSDYAPADLVRLSGSPLRVSRNDLSLRQGAYEAALTLSRAAADQGLTLVWSSSYRSWAYQKGVFERYAARDGEAKANTYSARPGQSQHQLGTAADFGDITLAFGRTPEGKWLFKNAGTYGWSLSFPLGHEEATGYQYEPWHYRYIGIKACAVQEKWFSGLQYLLLEFLKAHREELLDLTSLSQAQELKS